MNRKKERLTAIANLENNDMDYNVYKNATYENFNPANEMDS